jgi:hypothetical protein
VGFDDLPAGGESQPRAAFARFVRTVFRRIERLEDLRQFVGGNAAAHVANDEIDHLGCRVVLETNHEATAALHRLPGIDQKIQKDLLNLVANRCHLRHIVQVRFDGDAILRQLALH